ncbi:MAG: VWA domain-containing protein [Bryobacteraceae bacterium]|nr:VWA domain-containing protein [Bryobacteraceae bacterium]
MRLGWSALWILTALGLTAAQPPEQLPTIRVDVQVVNILCSVRDSKGRLVPDLTKEDFLVSEEGKPQEIRYFSRQTDLPLTIGLLIDVSGSQKNLLETEKRTADQFFTKVLQKKDLAFLISFGPDAELVQDSTNSIPLLRRALDSLRIRQDFSGVYRGPVPTVTRPRGTVLFDAVYLASVEKLRHEVGRKAIIVITDGVDIGSRVKLSEAIAEAQKADAIIYSIHYADPRAYGFPAYGVAAGESDLKRMSEETGGRLFRVDRKYTLERIFSEIEEEMRSQYSIGYVPVVAPTPGTYRRLEVRVRQKGMKVQARKGYYAASPAETP